MKFWETSEVNEIENYSIEIAQYYALQNYSKVKGQFLEIFLKLLS